MKTLLAYAIEAYRLGSQPIDIHMVIIYFDIKV
jgi:hypothetical protein